MQIAGSSVVVLFSHEHWRVPVLVTGCRLLMRPRGYEEIGLKEEVETGGLARRMSARQLLAALITAHAHPRKRADLRAASRLQTCHGPYR